MNIEEYKKFAEETRTKLEEYKHTFEESFSEDIIEGISNIEFIVRMDMSSNQMREIVEMLNR